MACADPVPTTYTTCEMMWLKTLLWELGTEEDCPIPIYCDNQAAIYTASNPIFQEKTKHTVLIVTL